MRIGELAKQLGVATSKIRFLEASGLIEPTRLASGYRDYDDDSVATLEIILQAQSFGFTLEEIGRSLTERKGEGLDRGYIVKMLAVKLAELDRHIQQTVVLRANIEHALKEYQDRILTNQPPCDTAARKRSLP
ncbi:MAG TPA: MerR family transcriptional regulator [Burkholderiaceae bacterium]|jgi:DNA-binding transcriptional MerR regulator|nr:MerR family transcriptional regulator [Burkholderiaceae bacterium]